MMDAMSYESSKRIPARQIRSPIGSRMSFTFASLALQSLNDLFPMETAVFDENLTGMLSACDHAS
jgi:hypothetical protein